MGESIASLLPFEITYLEWQRKRLGGRKAEKEPPKATLLDEFWAQNYGTSPATLSVSGSSDGGTDGIDVINLNHLNQAKTNGNELYKLKDYSAAQEQYTMAIRAMQKIRPVHHILIREDVCEGAEKARLTLVSTDYLAKRNLPMAGISVFDRVLQSALYTNRARCFIGLGKELEAIQDLSTVIGIFDCSDDEIVRKFVSADNLSEKECKEKLAKGYYLRAQAKLQRQKFDAAKADIETGRTKTGCSLNEFAKLEREILGKRQAYVKGNKSIAREIAKWADKAMDEMGGEV